MTTTGRPKMVKGYSNYQRSKMLNTQGNANGGGFWLEKARQKNTGCEQ